MINAAELTLLGTLVPLTALAVTVAVALHIVAARPSRPKARQFTIAGITASVIPLLLAVGLAFAATISEAVGNLVIGVSIAFLLAASGWSFWVWLGAGRVAAEAGQHPVTIDGPTGVMDPTQQPTEPVEMREAPGPAASSRLQPHPFPQPAERATVQTISGASSTVEDYDRTGVRVYAPRSEENVEKDNPISVQIITPGGLKHPQG